MPIEADEIEARRYRISGRVQGVGFRWWTRTVAEELGLVGSVRNLPGGSVEVHAEGGCAELDRFEALLREGPRFADVRRVEAVEGAAVEGADGFRIAV